jgi:translation elongation factor EF-Tu-like GTPase
MACVARGNGHFTSLSLKDEFRCLIAAATHMRGEALMESAASGTKPSFGNRLGIAVVVLVPVCIENLIRCDCVTESHNVSANGRADILLAERGCLALQVEEPA